MQICITTQLCFDHQVTIVQVCSPENWQFMKVAGFGNFAMLRLVIKNLILKFSLWDKVKQSNERDKQWLLVTFKNHMLVV